MDTRTGDLATLEQFRQTFSPAEVEAFVRPVELSALPAKTRIEFLRTGIGKIGRNAPCPCGSSRRFKRCCMNAATQQIE